MVSPNSKNIIRVGVAKDTLWKQGFYQLFKELGFDVPYEWPGPKGLTYKKGKTTYEICQPRSIDVPRGVTEIFDMGFTGLDMAVASNRKIDVLKKYPDIGKAEIMLARKRGTDITLEDILDNEKTTRIALPLPYMNIAYDFFYGKENRRGRLPNIKFIPTSGVTELYLYLESCDAILELKQEGKSLKTAESEDFYKIMNTCGVLITKRDNNLPEEVLETFDIELSKRTPIEKYMLYR